MVGLGASHRGSSLGELSARDASWSYLRRLGGGRPVEPYFETASVDLGQHSWVEQVPFSLVLVNPTKERLTVEAIRSSCGCTVVDVPQDAALEPHSTLGLSGLFSTGAVAGKRSATVDVRLDNGAAVVCNVEVEVVPTYIVVPEIVDFTGVRRVNGHLEVPVQEVVFASEAHHVTLAGPPTVDVPWLTCEVVQQGPNRTVLRLGVKDSGIVPGLQTGTVTLTTTCRHKPKAGVYVRLVAPYDREAP